MQKIRNFLGRSLNILKQILTLVPRMYIQSKEYEKDKRSFGSKIARYIWRDRVFCGCCKTKYIKVIQEYVDEFLMDLTERYKERQVLLPREPYVDKVWCCWWQGESSMPELVKKCVDSIKNLCLQMLNSF